MRVRSFGSPAPGGTRPGNRVLIPFAVVLAGLFLVSFARPRLPARPPGAPRPAAEIRRALEAGPHAGTCETCHTAHAGAELAPQPHALIGPDDNTLCDRCHTEAWQGGSYPDAWLYVGSAHGGVSTMVWPGPDPPGRVEADAAGKCVNCHDPHGWTDAAGPIPGLRLAREESLCLTCHDGHPAATDIRADLLKPFRHPTTTVSGRHSGPGEESPADYGISPLNRRHAECEDCHNPHVARGDAGGPPPPPEASKRLLGVSRVRVTNAGAGMIPAYTFIPASDTLTGPPAEHELCFKCHSSWTTQPPGQTDLARALNPNNRSYHPVEAAGRNPGIDAATFRPGWSAASRVRCGDCHGSDFGLAAGPHGSIHRHILRRPYAASAAPRVSTPDELCFRCHDYDVYANPGAPQAVRAGSRFNAPGAAEGHAEHVGDRQVPCYACHETHGSPTRPFLIAVGRSPGLLDYTETPIGGSCTSSCHGPESYEANYAR